MVQPWRLDMTLANQNRPRRFSEYIGQGNNEGGCVDYIKTVIKMNLHPSAIWLVGNSGSGKTSLAQLYARATLCPNREENSYEPCGVCEVCNGDNTDNITHYVVKDASEVKDAFQELIDLSNSSPHTITDRGDQLRRFILVDELQNASRQTVSMLLDPLEFSPPTTTWILVSMDPNKLDPVVREAIESRCKELNLRSFSKDEIANKLSSNVNGLSLEAATAIAYFSSGNMRKAWSILEYFMTMSRVEDITADRIMKEKSGGASKESRNSMWSCFNRGDYEGLRRLVDGWCDRSDPDLIASLLIEDLIHSDMDMSKLDILASLSRWKMSHHRPPLSALLMTHSGPPIKEENLPLVKVEALPVADDVSKSIDSDFNNALAKMRVKKTTSVFSMKTFSDIAEATR